MTAMVQISAYGYPAYMPKAPPRAPVKRIRKSKAKLARPNRIYELNKLRGLTNEDVAKQLGDDVHETTISRLSTGKITMTQEWMERLAPIYNVAPHEIVWQPPAVGLRRVTVKGALQAGSWIEAFEWDADQQYDVMIPDDPSLRGVVLYAGEIRGDSMDKRYPPGGVVILSAMHSTYEELKVGQRYHVRQTRSDGKVEETIKTLVRDDKGNFWLRPESSNPEYQQWLSLDGGDDGTTIEMVGRVRFTVLREM